MEHFAATVRARYGNVAEGAQAFDSTPWPPLIICGDFNSVPDSGVYELLSKGSVSPGDSAIMADVCGLFSVHGGHIESALSKHGIETTPAAPLAHQTSNVKMPSVRAPSPMSVGLKHSLHVSSAYNTALGGEPAFTLYTGA